MNGEARCGLLGLGIGVGDDAQHVQRQADLQPLQRGVQQGLDDPGHGPGLVARSDDGHRHAAQLGVVAEDRHQGAEDVADDLGWRAANAGLEAQQALKTKPRRRGVARQPAREMRPQVEVLGGGQ